MPDRPSPFSPESLAALADDPRLLELLENARRAYDELADYLEGKSGAAGARLKGQSSAD